MQDPRRPKIASSRHHWWPISLQNFWTGADGKLTRLSFDGSEVRSAPVQFARSWDANHIIVGGPWDETFEPSFNSADGSFPPLVEWLGSLESGAERPYDSLDRRFRPHDLLPFYTHALAICIASLVSRSPLVRERIRKGIEAFHNEHAIKGYKAPDHLIAMNRRHMASDCAKHLESGGRFIVLFSNSVEFIFGDGFLNNFPTSMPFSTAFKCVLPITPGISVIYVRPVQYRMLPKLQSITLSDEEVHYFNDLVHIYSAKEVFYRSQKPRPNINFDGEHREFKYHREDFLDSFIDAALGQPTFSLREEKWLEDLLDLRDSAGVR